MVVEAAVSESDGPHTLYAFFGTADQKGGYEREVRMRRKVSLLAMNQSTLTASVGGVKSLGHLVRKLYLVPFRLAPSRLAPSKSA